MRDDIKNLKGSPYRDAVKAWHKNLPGGKKLFAADNDLNLIDAASTMITCLDAKKPGSEDIRWSHKQTYGWYAGKGVPVYLVSPLDYTEKRCQHCGNIDIEIKPDSKVKVIRYADMVSTVFQTPEEYVKWEKQLRQRIKKDLS